MLCTLEMGFSERRMAEIRMEHSLNSTLSSRKLPWLWGTQSRPVPQVNLCPPTFETDIETSVT